MKRSPQVPAQRGNSHYLGAVTQGLCNRVHGGHKQLIASRLGAHRGWCYTFGRSQKELGTPTWGPTAPPQMAAQRGESCFGNSHAVCSHISLAMSGLWRQGWVVTLLAGPKRSLGHPLGAPQRAPKWQYNGWIRILAAVAQCFCLRTEGAATRV